VELSARDRDMLEGRHGPAAAMAMAVLARMAEVYGAGALLDISHAHIDSTIYIGEATLEYAERLASLGARVAVPTTLNVSGLDEHGWREWAVPPEWARNAHRQMVAYQSMGAAPTWTCAPYQSAFRPAFGQQIAWGESNAIAFANSVLGARTERYPDLLDICCAITGRAPAAGLHLPENRAGQVLLSLDGVPRHVQEDDLFYPVLGALMGQLAGDQIPVIDGLEIAPSEDRLKALAAAGATTGCVALFHVVGVTPEAATRGAAFQGRRPVREVAVTLPMLDAMRRRLSTAADEALDLVVLGSPHFSLDEFRRLAPLVAGRERHPRVEFLVTTSRMVRELADAAGLLAPVVAFGGRLTVDTCILATPMLPDRIRTLMTNSAKFAYYSPGLLGKAVAFGSLDDCVESAVAGRIVTDESRWAHAERGHVGAGAASTRAGVHAAPGTHAPPGGGSGHACPEKGNGRQDADLRATHREPLVIQSRPLVAGNAEGTALVGREPLSFWGGYDSRSGEIIDRAHPLSGLIAAGRILVLPFSRGSSTTTAVLLESIRAGTAPAAIVVTGHDTFFALASIVAGVMYGCVLPIVEVEEAQLALVRTGDDVRVGRTGQVVVRRRNV
jgi:predicted aconitase/predicted aconitase with swiveling domain